MVGVTGLTGEVIVTQIIDIGRTALLGDLLQNGRGEHFGTKDGRHLFGANLGDEISHIPGGWFGKVRRLNGANHSHAIERRKVGPRVMIGEQFAVSFGDGSDDSLNCFVKRGDAFDKGGVVGLVIVGIGGVTGAQRIAYQFSILQRMKRIGPKVWIGAARFFGKGEVKEILLRRDRLVAQQDNFSALF